MEVDVKVVPGTVVEAGVDETKLNEAGIRRHFQCHAFVYV
jgi:hypothetical protein